MSDILCDLALLECRFNEWKNFVIYWRHNSHFTDVSDYREYAYRQLEIKYNHVAQCIDIEVLEADPAKVIYI